MGVATFSGNGNGNYKIDVDAAVVSQNGPGNYSTIYWRIYVIKTNTTGHRAWGNTGSSGWADSNIGGNPDLWSNGNMEYNFQNGSMSGTFLIADGQFNIGHRSDGNQEYFVNGGLNLANLGSASAGTGTRSLSRIQTASVPPAPSPVGFGERTLTSIQYLFHNNGDGGTPVREWQALYQDATTNGPQIGYWSDGGTPIGGLTPGHVYNFWSRGRNDVGWGPWSNISSVRTATAARIKINGVWKEVIPYIKINGEWHVTQPHVKVNGVWHKTG
jgi:hypothetical protein